MIPFSKEMFRVYSQQFALAFNKLLAVANGNYLLGMQSLLLECVDNVAHILELIEHDQ